MLTILIASTLLAAMTVQDPRPAPASFSAAELEERLGAAGGRWLQFLRERSLTCGLYRLPAGGTDGQSPHALDEIYYVVSGRAELDVAGARHPATPGAVLFVPAGVEHRFVDITADLTVLVVFSQSRPTRGGMAAGPRPTEQTPYDEGSERGSARVFYWYRDGSAGQLEIVYGRPAWQPAYGQFLSAPSGRRWRFGENFWTTLDTNIPITVGGVRLDVGQYYLVLHNDADAGLRVLALDPTAIRERRLDAYEADETEGGIALPLQHQETDGKANRLTIDLVVDRSEPHHAELRVRFGPHLLTAPIVMEP